MSESLKRSSEAKIYSNNSTHDGNLKDSNNKTEINDTPVTQDADTASDSNYQSCDKDETLPVHRYSFFLKLRLEIKFYLQTFFYFFIYFYFFNTNDFFYLRG